MKRTKESLLGNSYILIFVSCLFTLFFVCLLNSFCLHFTDLHQSMAFSSMDEDNVYMQSYHLGRHKKPPARNILTISTLQLHRYQSNFKFDFNLEFTKKILNSQSHQWSNGRWLFSTQSVFQFEKRFQVRKKRKRNFSCIWQQSQEKSCWGWWNYYQIW